MKIKIKNTTRNICPAYQNIECRDRTYKYKNPDLSDRDPVGDDGVEPPTLPTCKSGCSEPTELLTLRSFYQTFNPFSALPTFQLTFTSHGC